MSAVAAVRQRFGLVLLVGPALAVLLALLVAPVAILARTSLEQGSLEEGYRVVWSLRPYRDALAAYAPHFGRSAVYAGAATAIALAAGYPLAYVLAFRAGRWRTLLLGLVVLPFLTTYLIRTLAWQTILGDAGPVVAALRWTGVLPPDGRLLSTALAVVGGLTYELLPFMVLPIYVALDRIDTRLVDAASDLYATPGRAFRRVVLPQSLPGVFAGTLLTFVPAAGDFVNAQLLGGPGHSMVGNVVQSRFLVLLDYPSAAAISLVLVAAILVAVAAYARLLGLEEVTP